MAGIDVPLNWDKITDKPHPEETNLVTTVSWFQHESGAEVVIWEGGNSDLEKDERYQVEIRNPKNEILMQQGFSEDAENQAFSWAKEQMENYPVQEVITEE